MEFLRGAPSPMSWLQSGVQRVRLRNGRGENGKWPRAKWTEHGEQWAVNCRLAQFMNVVIARLATYKATPRRIATRGGNKAISGPFVFFSSSLDDHLSTFLRHSQRFYWCQCQCQLVSEWLAWANALCFVPPFFRVFGGVLISNFFYYRLFLFYCHFFFFVLTSIILLLCQLVCARLLCLARLLDLLRWW